MRTATASPTSGPKASAPPTPPSRSRICSARCGHAASRAYGSRMIRIRCCWTDGNGSSSPASVNFFASNSFRHPDARPSKIDRVVLNWPRLARAKRRTEAIGRAAAMAQCDHLDTIEVVTPGTLGCQECLKSGSVWLHLRLCRSCGHVGCCDQSPGRHATKHFQATGHPIIEGYDPPEGWAWCYVDEVMIDLGDNTTPQIGPIPRYY